MYGENQLLEDFLDMIEVEASKNESDEYIPIIFLQLKTI